MKHVIARAALFGVVVALVGCQTATVKMAESEAQFAQRTPQGFETLTPVSVVFPDLNEAFVENSEFSSAPSGVILLSDGERSVGRLYRLPKWDRAYSIQISSAMIGTLEDPGLFYPRATLFDSNFKQTRHTTQKDFVFRSMGRNAAISTHLWMNQSNSADAFLLISGEPRANLAEAVNPLQSSGTVVVPVPIGPVVFIWAVPTGGTELPMKMKASLTGPVRVTIKPSVAKIISPDAPINPR